MATPNRSHAVSTPKGHRDLPSTPNKMMASPRPGSSAVANKSLSYKSPAVKTPASAHGHAHTVSVSSQPSSTPLAAAAIHDELLNLNSPAAALINSMASNGLTPAMSGQNGLGINSIPGTLPASKDGQASTDPETQRAANLETALALMRSKGVSTDSDLGIAPEISRNSVQEIVKLRGFEAHWFENTLNVAGNVVDLEIHFDSSSRDQITMVALKLDLPDVESHILQRASDILKKDLDISEPDHYGLKSFTSHVEYLAHLDKIDTSPDAFHLIESLGEAFKSIWAEEEKHMIWKSTLHHIRKGLLGLPSMDQAPRLGLEMEYWAAASATGDLNEGTPTGFQAYLMCEIGGPGILPTLKWLGPGAPLIAVGNDDMQPDGQKFRPNWFDPLDGANPTSEQPTQLNAHFVCTLEPAIMLPHNVAIRMGSEVCSVDINQNTAAKYLSILHENYQDLLRTADSRSQSERLSRNLHCFDRFGKASCKTHSYRFYSAPQTGDLWAVPVSRLTFDHPKQLCTALEILRQYALVYQLLTTLADPGPDYKAGSETEEKREQKVIKRSNKRHDVDVSDEKAGTQSEIPTKLMIDVTLDFLSDPATCRIALLAPKPARPKPGADRFIRLQFVVGGGGIVKVENVTGVACADLSKLRHKIAKAIEETEDLGVVFQWLADAEETAVG